MNINMFFEFPGILITIGVVLLIISILIILIAIRSDKKAELDFVKADSEAFENKENELKTEKEDLEVVDEPKVTSSVTDESSASLTNDQSNDLFEKNLTDQSLENDNEDDIELL